MGGILVRSSSSERRPPFAKLARPGTVREVRKAYTYEFRGDKGVGRIWEGKNTEDQHSRTDNPISPWLLFLLLPALGPMMAKIRLEEGQLAA